MIYLNKKENEKKNTEKLKQTSGENLTHTLPISVEQESSRSRLDYFLFFGNKIPEKLIFKENLSTILDVEKKKTLPL